jgi:hypothetical protein
MKNKVIILGTDLIGLHSRLIHAANNDNDDVIIVNDAGAIPTDTTTHPKYAPTGITTIEPAFTESKPRPKHHNKKYQKDSKKRKKMIKLSRRKNR